MQIQALSKDFRDLLLLFNKHGVRYLVVGGYAVTAYGVPRYTKDIDLWIDRANDNVVKVLTSLREFGFESLGLVEGDFADPETMIQLGYEPNPPKRAMVMVARKLRFAEVEAETRAFWASQSPAQRIIELESLRRMWPEITGDPDEPMVRVIHKRRRGEPAVKAPT